MKRITGIICLIVLTTMLAAPAVFGAAKELKLVKSYPESGSTSMPVENVGIKLYFDDNVIDESVWENNKKCFSFKDKKGKSIPTQAFSNMSSGTDYILVTANPKGGSLKPNSEYIMTISKDLRSESGSNLSSDMTVKFKTVDTDFNMKINMGMMVVMVVGMVAMNAISTKRAMKKDDKKKDDKVNPYKVAKEKGKSVEEVVSKIEKEKERKGKKQKDKEIEEDDEPSTLVKRVSSPKPISQAGSTLVSGTKARAEEKARKDAQKKAKGTTNPKNKKNKKKKKKKK